MLRPIFKYAGSKARMLGRYRNYFRGLHDKEYFVDYFAGTGLVSQWMHSLYPAIPIVMNELNPELFSIYEAIRSDFDGFAHLLEMQTTEYLALTIEERERYYYQVRARYAEDTCAATEKAANLYFMLLTNFNGIWQVRADDGSYFTSFGRGTERALVDY